MNLFDTHCHIHSIDYALDAKEVIANAMAHGVTKMVCVGTDHEDSKQAVDFVQNQPHCFAAAGIHPHESKRYSNDPNTLVEFAKLASSPKVVAVGECGLDYFYNHSPKNCQIELLHFQLQLAKDKGLPLIFHIREAFEEFWPIFDQYKGLKGVIHSFTASQTVLDQALARNLYIGLNGIMTFTKNVTQLEVAKAIPLQNLLLETDSPFLTPVPFRGKVCQPMYVGTIAKFLSELRQERLEDLAQSTSLNASALFNVNL